VRKVRAGVAGVSLLMVVGVLGTLLGGCRLAGSEQSREQRLDGAVRRGQAETNRIVDELEKVGTEPGGERFGECEAVGTTVFFALTYEARRLHLGDPDRAEWDAQLESLLAAVPSDLQDELAVVQAGGRASMQAFGVLRPEDLVDPAIEQRGADAQEAFDTPEIHRAFDTIEAFLLDCPPR